MAQDTVRSHAHHHDRTNWRLICYTLAALGIVTACTSLYSNHLHTSNINRYINQLSTWQTIEATIFRLKDNVTANTFDAHNTVTLDNIKEIKETIEQIDSNHHSFSTATQQILNTLAKLKVLIRANQQTYRKLQGITPNTPLESALLKELNKMQQLQHKLLADSIILVAEVKESFYRQKENHLSQAKHYEYLALGLAGIFVLFTLFYGRNIASKARENKDELELHWNKLKEERLNLEAQIEEQTKEIRAESLKNALLGKIAESSNQSRTLESALKGAIREVLGFTKWNLGHCYLKLTSEKDEIHVWGTSTRDRYAIPLIESTEAIRQPLDVQIIPGLSSKQNQATWITDIEENDHFSRKSIALEVGLKGIAAVPIIIDEEPLGFIEFFSRNKMHPTFETILILERLSSMMVRVIEKHRNQISLEAAKERAEEASKAKTEFLSNMSHELRTPMHAILRFSENGMEEYKTASKQDLHEYFCDIHKSGTRLTKLINNLLDLSKLESDLPDMVFSKSNLPDINNHAIKELKSLISEKSLTLETLYQDAMPTIDADGDKLTQVIINLLSNAIKFSPKKSRVSIEITHSDTCVTYCIEDEGAGIPEHEVESIFDQFIQSSKTKNKAGGTGLGLSICRTIIKLHNGEIYAQNNPDKGASFIFTIPITQSHSEAPNEGE